MYVPKFETDCNQVELIFVTSCYHVKVSHTSISIWDEPRGKNLRVESAHAQPFHFESCYLEWKKTHIPHQRRQLLSRPLDRWQRWFLLRGSWWVENGLLSLSCAILHPIRFFSPFPRDTTYYHPEVFSPCWFKLPCFVVIGGSLAPNRSHLTWIWIQVVASSNKCKLGEVIEEDKAPTSSFQTRKRVRIINHGNNDCPENFPNFSTLPISKESFQFIYPISYFHDMLISALIALHWRNLLFLRNRIYQL